MVLGVDEELLKRKTRSIPRADVAELAVQTLALPGAAALSFDCVAEAEGEGQPTTDWAGLVAGLGGRTAAYAPLPEAARV